MPPKYSTRRHKYKNKNAKTSKQYKRKKGMPQRTKYIVRPDEVTFNDAERIEFVTGFAKRKQERRIKAAKALVHLQDQQHIEWIKERREQETEYLIKGGHIDDPVSVFLEQDYNIGDDNVPMSEAEPEPEPEDEENDSDSIVDINELMHANGHNDEDNNEVQYENDAMVTTVITSIPTQIDRFISQQNDSDMNWIHDRDNESDKKGELSVYELRKDHKRKAEINESKKKYQRKVKKMLQFVKEFNRNKKRRSNSKYSKKKRKNKKSKKK